MLTRVQRDSRVLIGVVRRRIVRTDLECVHPTAAGRVMFTSKHRRMVRR